MSRETVGRRHGTVTRASSYSHRRVADRGPAVAVDGSVIDAVAVRRRRRFVHKVIAAVLALATLVVIGLFAWTDDEEVVSVDARSADSFVDSIGVNVHMHYSPGPYTEVGKVRKAILESGIRHVRDYPNNVAALTELGEAGIRLSAIVGSDRLNSWARPFPVYWSGVEELAPYLSSIENTNEPNRRDPAGWPDVMRAQQERIWRTAKADPRLAEVPIVGPSLTRPNTSGERQGDLGSYLDWGNIHPYPADRKPEDSRVDTELAAAQRYNAGGKPVLATETGYHNSADSVSEEAAAVYVPRMIFHYFNLGIVRTYLYELVDQGLDDNDHQDNYGLVRRDFTRKPAFTALKNTIGLLEDPGPAFTPTALPYRLKGVNSKTNTSLLQKRDGSYWLAVWQGASVWDNEARRMLEPADAALTLSVDGVAGFRVYRPNEGVQVLRATTGSTVRFNSSADVTLIEILPVAPAPAPAPAPQRPVPESAPPAATRDRTDRRRR